MKKLIALLLAVVMVIGLAACGSSTTTETKAPTEAKVDTPATEAKTDAPAAEGSVYYLNFKPEADGALQELATLYTETTQGRHRRFRHLFRHPDRADGQGRRSHHLQHRQHVRSEGLG